MDINTLPRWQCHKVVRAAKIVAIDDVPNSTNIRVSLKRGPDAETETTVMDGGWFARHSPEVGGYLVVYSDSYTSFSPAAAFEEGYTLLDRFDAYGTAEVKSDGG